MEFFLFGPLDVRAGPTDRLDLHGAKRRGLLALLLVHRGRPVSVDRLVDALWDGAASKGATGTVQTYVSQLRRAFDQDASVQLTRRGGGYVLDIAPEFLDIARFEQLLLAADECEGGRERVELLGDALGLWRGTPLEEFDGEWATIERARLERLRIEARLRRVDVQLGIGDDRVVLPELETLVGEHPLDEGIWSRLIVTLYRCGRQGDALRACRDVRQLLVEQLGVDPGAELASVERRILDHDDTVRWPLDDVAPAAVREASPLPTGTVTFLFTDIEGSTALWDTLPSAMADALPKQEKVIAAAVGDHSGTFVKGKGEGDSTLSVFARASDAAAAALQIRAGLARETWPDGIALPTRIALHSGEAQLRDGDYFGSTLNRAARIRALATGGQIVCSRATADLVSDSLAAGFVLGELGTHQLRGLRRSETVYEIHSADDPHLATDDASVRSGDLETLYPSFGQRPGARRAATGRAPLTFVGRSGELTALRRHWHAALRGRAATVLLQGPLGIGKTRLLEELARLAEDEPGGSARVVWGRSYEHARLPYLALRDSLLPLLVDRGTEHSIVLTRSFDPDAGDDATGLDPNDRGRLLLAFAQAVVDLAREQPLLLIVDDMQWADQATLDVVRHVTWLAQRERAPLLVLAACRTPLESGELAAAVAQLEREPRCSVAHIAPLAEHEVGGLVAQLGIATARGTIQRVRQITNGNPLLVQQLTEELHDLGASTVVDDVIEQFTATTAADTTAIRLRTLSDDTREVLTLAALLEPSATRRLLDRAAPGLPKGVALADGVRIGVIEMRGARVQFTHPVYPRVLVGELAPVERKRMHRRLAETLVADPEHRATAIEIASHFARAGDLASPREVLRATRAGGDEAFASCAWREAAECYEAAVRALSRIEDPRQDVAAELQFRAALCRMWNLDDERALTAFDRAIELFEELGDRRALVRARLERMRVELTNATPFAQVDARPLEKEISELPDDDPLRAQALADLAMAYAVSGRTADASEAAEAALTIADVGVPRAAARAHLAQSVTAWAYLDLHGAIEHLDRAIAHAHAAGDAYSHLAAAVRRALTLLWLGDVQEADEAGASALAVGEQHNLVFGMVYTLAARAGAACFSGRSDEAAAFADEVVLRQRLGDYAWGLTFSQPTFAAMRAITHGADAANAVLERFAHLRDENPAGYPWGGYTDVFDVAVQLITDPDARTTDITVPSWLATTQISGALGWSGIAAAVAEIAWWKRDPVLAENARLGLKWCDESDLGVVDGWLASVPRALGIATAAGGDHEEGRRLIARGRDWARHQHADLEHSLCGWWECEIARFDGVQAPPDAVIAARTCPMS